MPPRPGRTAGRASWSWACRRWSFGSGLLVGVIAFLAAMIWRRDDRRTFLVALAVLAIAFFVLPTRVHERYLYPFFALGAVLVAVSPRWIGVYAALAVANTANLYGILTEPFYANLGLEPMLGALGGLGAQLGDAVRSWGGVATSAVVHAGGLLAGLATWSGRHRRRPTRQPPLLAENAERAAAAASPDGPAGAGAAAGSSALRRARGSRSGRSWGGLPAACAPSPAARPSIARSCSTTRAAGGSTGSTCGSSWCSSSRRCSCGRSGSASRCGCTSTRSTTLGRQPSSCRTGATASRTRSTSGPTRTSPST